MTRSAPAGTDPSRLRPGGGTGGSEAQRHRGERGRCGLGGPVGGLWWRRAGPAGAGGRAPQRPRPRRQRRYSGQGLGAKVNDRIATRRQKWRGMQGGSRPATRWPHCARWPSTRAGRSTGSSGRCYRCLPVDPELLRATHQPEERPDGCGCSWLCWSALHALLGRRPAWSPPGVRLCCLGQATVRTPRRAMEQRPEHTPAIRGRHSTVSHVRDDESPLLLAAGRRRCVAPPLDHRIATSLRVRPRPPARVPAQEDILCRGRCSHSPQHGTGAPDPGVGGKAMLYASV